MSAGPKSFLKLDPVQALLVTEDNLDDAAKWCRGYVLDGMVYPPSDPFYPEVAFPGQWIVLDNGVFSVYEDENFIERFVEIRYLKP